MCSCSGGCSCSSNSTILPIGPTGPTGATGATGASGSNGTNGTTIIANYTSATGVTQPVNTVETSLSSLTIPANTISTNGDEIESYVYITGTAGSAGTSVTLRFKLGGLTILTTSVNTDTILNFLLFKTKITRTSAGNQLWTIDKVSVTSTPTYITTLASVASAMDETISNTFQVTAQGSGAGCGQLTLFKSTLYKYSA